MAIAIFPGTTIAKYRTEYVFKNKTEIEIPILIVEGNEISKINEISNIGYYEFTIKNYNEAKVSETGFLYTIEIVSKTDESVKFELYKGEEQIQLENLKTQKLSIPGKEKIEQKYKLKVIYDESQETQGKNILEEIQIKVHSEQTG